MTFEALKAIRWYAHTLTWSQLNELDLELKLKNSTLNTLKEIILDSSSSIIVCEHTREKESERKEEQKKSNDKYISVWISREAGVNTIRESFARAHISLESCAFIFPFSAMHFNLFAPLKMPTIPRRHSDDYERRNMLYLQLLDLFMRFLHFFLSSSFFSLSLSLCLCICCAGISIVVCCEWICWLFRFPTQPR